MDEFHPVSNLTRLLFVISIISLLVGCASDSPQPRYYLLSPAPIPESRIISADPERCFNLRIARAVIPEYLNRPQIVTRTSEENLALSEYNLWAEPLEHTFARVLAENISRRVCTGSVAFGLRKSADQPETRIQVEVFRMDGTPGREAVLEAWWTVSGGVGPKARISQKSVLLEPLKDGTFDALVRAHSRNVGALSREIAEALTRLK